MKLPSVESAIVPEEKITQYLLNRAHPAGGSKAVFFLGFGFKTEEWQLLGEALLRHARDNEVVESEETRYGIRYAIDGPLVAPDGGVLNVRTAWYIDIGSTVPRFVTADPLPKK